MKKSDIKVGRSYSNGKGRVRKVLDVGEHCKIYDNCITSEWVRFEQEFKCDKGKKERELLRLRLLPMIHKQRGQIFPLAALFYLTILRFMV